ncbi:hypothetical protein I4U23_009506 [Adineta vaga]|nr:hypothetical protein I4U23_009506 [Adineta vaga]
MNLNQKDKSKPSIWLPIDSHNLHAIPSAISINRNRTAIAKKKNFPLCFSLDNFDYVDDSRAFENVQQSEDLVAI